MKQTSVWILATVLGLAVVVVPWVMPANTVGGAELLGYLTGGRLALGIALTYGYGVLTAATPCVYPLIPITVSVFGARKAESRGRAVLLTSAYVVGMGLVFALLGVLAARTGALFGSHLGRPGVTVPIALLLTLLAASMFGAFELNLPPSLAAKLSSVGGAGVLGALLMGSVSGFIAAPCTGPALSGLLLFVAQTKSPLLGGGLLFIYALGIGLPFLLIGAFAVQLPKGGAWMEWVKSVLGVLLLAMAVLTVKDSFAAMRGAMLRAGEGLGYERGAWIGGTLAALGVVLGAIHLSFKSHAREVAMKAAGVAVLVLALLLRMAALSAPAPAQLWLATKLGLARHRNASELAWRLKFGQSESSVQSFEAMLAQARAEGRPVMIDFFADWCAACKELDRETYVAPAVIDESSRFVTIKVDATNGQGSVDALQDRFGVKGLPTVAFISSKGEPLAMPRVTGFLGPAEFLAELRKVQ